MYNFTTLSTPPDGGDKGKKTPPINQDENQKFGNWTGSLDTKINASDLMKRGLIGADQLVNENQDISTPDAIKNKNQSDWKIAAMQQILANAKKFNLRTPEEVNANRNVLIGNPKWVEAINNPYFNNIHPNWWKTITDSILPEQWAKYDASKKDIAKK